MCVLQVSSQGQIRHLAQFRKPWDVVFAVELLTFCDTHFVVNFFVTPTVWSGRVTRDTLLHSEGPISEFIKKHGMFLLIYLKHTYSTTIKLRWYKISSVGSVSFLRGSKILCDLARDAVQFKSGKKLTLPTLEILYHHTSCLGNS